MVTFKFLVELKLSRGPHFRCSIQGCILFKNPWNAQWKLWIRLNLRKFIHMMMRNMNEPNAFFQAQM